MNTVLHSGACLTLCAAAHVVLADLSQILYVLDWSVGTTATVIWIRQTEHVFQQANMRSPSTAS